MKKRYLLPALLGSLVLQSCGKQTGTSAVKGAMVPKDEAPQVREIRDDQKVIEKLQTEVVKLYNHPTITVILIPKADVQNSIKSLVKGGGKLIYDPNNGLGSSIPFYIAELTPDQINDGKFLGSLKLKAAQIDNPKAAITPIKTKISTDDIDVTNYIPKDSVKIEELLEGNETTASLGKGVTVAVIDTGIDASHPGFNGRVDYWYDATQETRTKLTLSEVSAEGDITIDSKKFKLPKNMPQGKVYASIIKEKNFYAQLSEDSKEGRGYLDLNYNKSGDEFLMVAVDTEEGVKVYFDADADLAFNKSESVAKIDYNATTRKNRKEGMVTFPSRNNIISYPVLIEKEEEDIYVGFGKTSGMHGTHVAGIIAANDKTAKLEGVAPQAKLMSLRVCSEISCTDSAIIKALYKTFYNKKGLIPDVVNISLGSHERYNKGVYSLLLDDLSAKFGTIFFVSASNSGPGFRTLNHIGNTGAVVTVGANVSKKTLDDQYNLPDGAKVEDENMLFFSSLGPSYTGEMKPNIVAPGAAISTVLTAEGYMSQANGTSMSSPLAAGAMAAIIAKAKAKSPELFEAFSKIRTNNSQADQMTQGSLLPYVYAMRDALQQTAFEQKDLTRAQQGYGLIQAGAAKDKLLELLEELKLGKKTYFEVVLNGYKAAYERDEISELKKFDLSVGEDGERSKEETAKIISLGVDVVLDRVEILNTNGTMDIAKDKTKYFHIIDQGNINNKLTKTHVTFNNRRTKAFFSKRTLSKMKEGATYLAHYKVIQKGAVVQNILDVVHRPFKLDKMNVSVPAIDPSIRITQSGFAKKGVNIATNTFHRYPIMVTGTMNRIKAKVGIQPGFTGMLYVQLYDPRGKEMKFVYATDTAINEYEMANINVPTLLEGKVRTGIWELTISTSSSTWMSESKYDLLVEAESFGAKKAAMSMKAGESLDIPVELGGNKLSKAMMINLKQVHTETVKVKSGYVSFHPIVLKKDADTTVTVSLNDPKKAYWGNIAHKLYVKEGEKFVVYKGKVKSKAVGSSRMFMIPKTTETLYFGLDTIINYDMEGGLNGKVAGTVEAVLTYEGLVKSEIKTEVVNHSDFNMGLVKVTVPKTIGVEAMAEGGKKFITGTVVIVSGKVSSYTLASGETQLDIDKNANVNTVKLTIEE